MSIYNERFQNIKFIPNWVLIEHEARYRFASNFVKEKIVIDCACGAGIGSEIFLKADAGQVHAFDNSESVIKNLKAKNKDKNLFFSVADAAKLPLPNEFSDIYISLETIEHLEKDNLFLEEVKRLLKPGGLFICSTPNRKVTNPGKMIKDKPCNKFHVREYSPDEFTELLQKFFAKVEIYGQNPNYEAKARILSFTGKILPFSGAVRIHQLIKLLWFFMREKDYYEVKEYKKGYEHEFLIAVCRKQNLIS